MVIYVNTYEMKESESMYVWKESDINPWLGDLWRDLRWTIGNTDSDLSEDKSQT